MGALAILGFTACTHSSSSSTPAAAASPNGGVTLKAAFKDDFLVGAAINQKQFTGEDARGAALIAQQFNVVSPENVLKWEIVHPRRGEYDFGPGDQYVDFATKHGIAVIGHTLVWHSQTPRWVFQDSTGKPNTRDAQLAVMRDHIHTVVGHYKGRIKGWDVVNEALNEDGTLRKSPWHDIIGDDFIIKAFQFAHEADPNAELYYNDYSLENAPKRAGAVKLIQSLQAAGVKITAIGTQAHIQMNAPTPAQFDSTIRAFAATGVHVNVTELDVDVLPRLIRGQTADVSQRAAMTAAANPYASGLPDSVQVALAHRYADVFRVLVAHKDVIDRVTLWGVTDADSWLNDWPVPGRTSYPLLLDRAGRPKAAFDSVVATARAKK